MLVIGFVTVFPKNKCMSMDTCLFLDVYYSQSPRLTLHKKEVSQLGLPATDWTEKPNTKHFEKFIASSVPTFHVLT